MDVPYAPCRCSQGQCRAQGQGAPTPARRRSLLRAFARRERRAAPLRGQLLRALGAAAQAAAGEQLE